MRSKRSRLSSTERLRYGTFLAALSQRAAILPDFFGGEIADEGVAFADHLLRPLIELAEVIRRVENRIFLESEPVDVVDDGIDVFLLFFFGVGVVEAEIGFAAEFRGETEVQADGFGMADMQIAVGFGRKPSVDTALVLVRFQIVEDDVANEVGGPAAIGSAE